MVKVVLEAVMRRFANVTAVEGITFEVPDGEFWVLVGPSGCGKSTILRTIAGLEAATAGSIYIGDRRVNEVPARNRDVAMVFQNYALYPHMSVADNLAFGLRMRRVDAQTTQERVAEVAQALGIADFLQRKPGQLSGGQQQRVALGRAIARQPQVFLLDEPLSNLDAQLRDDTRAELKQLHQQLGITTLYVTHDQVEAMTLADQIVVLDQGKIQQIGPPQTIYSQPHNRMVATFMGSPPINILPAFYDQQAFHTGPYSIPCPRSLWPMLEEIPDCPLSLGIRPEHLQIEQPPDPHLQAVVNTVEPLGSENLIRGVVADQPHIALHLRVAPQFFPRPGDRLELSLDLDQLMVFDAASGARISQS